MSDQAYILGYESAAFAYRRFKTWFATVVTDEAQHFPEEERNQFTRGARAFLSGIEQTTQSYKQTKSCNVGFKFILMTGDKPLPGSEHQGLDCYTTIFFPTTLDNTPLAQSTKDFGFIAQTATAFFPSGSVVIKTLESDDCVYSHLNIFTTNTEKLGVFDIFIEGVLQAAINKSQSREDNDKFLGLSLN